MAARLLLIIGACAIGLGLLFHTIGTSTSQWSVSKDENTGKPKGKGLWKTCTAGLFGRTICDDNIDVGDISKSLQGVPIPFS